MSRKKSRVENLSPDVVANLAHDPLGPRTQVWHDTEVRRLGVRVNPGGMKVWVLDGRTVIGKCDEISTTTARRIVATDGALDGPVSPSSWTWRKGLAFYAEKHRTAQGRPAGESPPVASKLAQVEKHAPFIDRPMETTTPGHVETWLVTYLDSKPPRPVQYNALRRLLETVWRFNFRKSRVSRGSPVLCRPADERPKRDHMTEEELAEFFSLLRVCKHGAWAEAYAKLSYSLALRGHEGLRLAWDHVDRSRRVIIVPKRKTSGQFRWRIYTMTAEALDIIEAQRAEFDRMSARGARKGYPMNQRQRASDALFPAPRGGESGWVELPRELSRVAQKHWPGRKLTSHTLRRSRCTHLRNAGKTDLQICGLSGHGDARELQRYLGDVPDAVLDDLDV